MSWLRCDDVGRGYVVGVGDGGGFDQLWKKIHVDMKADNDDCHLISSYPDPVFCRASQGVPAII